MTILEKIIAEKEIEVHRLKENYQVFDHIKNRTETSMYQKFQNATSMNIIAEIKRASPSKGDINPNVDPVEQAKQYEQLGAGMISVLTDEPFFKGTMEDLANVRKSVGIPVLCKDFIIDEIQIDRAKDYGANVVLLIAAAMNPQRLKELYDYANSQNLEVLLEVHNEQELETALEVGAKIIGINNRDLKTFVVDLAVTEKLAALIEDPKVLLIGESGVKTKEDVERLKEAGVKGILVGETLMRSTNLAETFNQLKVSF